MNIGAADWIEGAAHWIEGAAHRIEGALYSNTVLRRMNVVSGRNTGEILKTLKLLKANDTFKLQ